MDARAPVMMFSTAGSSKVQRILANREADTKDLQGLVAKQMELLETYRRRDEETLSEHGHLILTRPFPLMAEVIPFKVDGQVDGMDFDQAATACGVQRPDFGASLPNAMEKYQRVCRTYWTTHTDAYAGSKRKTDTDDTRPARQRNFLPVTEGVATMRSIVEKYGQLATTARALEAAELRARLEAMAVYDQRVAFCRAAGAPGTQ